MNELAVHRLVPSSSQCGGNGLKLVEVQGMIQLMLQLLNCHPNLIAPGHRLFLLSCIGRLVDEHLGDSCLTEHVQRPRAEVSQHCRGELLACGLAGHRAHSLLQELLHLRSRAKSVGRVSSVVLGEDITALRHDAFGAVQVAPSSGLVQRRVANGIPLVGRKVLWWRHQQLKLLEMALECRPMQWAVLFLSLHRLVVLVDVCGVVLDQ
mmetsp:Transcript_36505/g.58874  ORF Transcript_36505/g.58874 Transcript_36505/m.58874 type:complete len:208 (-) Transcript_36505:368-991(-)